MLGPTVYLNEYLAQIGMLRFRGESGRGYHRVTSALEEAYSMAHKLLPAKIRTWLTRRYRRAKSRFDSFLAVSRIDWQRTKAFCPEVFRTGDYVWVNLKGREPCGTVEPGAEYEEVLNYLTQRLLELKNPENGKPVIDKIHRREEVFHGPHVHRAADLFLDNWEGGGFQIRPSSPGQPGRPVVAGRASSPAPGELTGVHRYDGVLLMMGRAFKSGVTIHGARIIDLAPTILSFFGLPIPDDMDGRVLIESFSSEFLTTHRPQGEQKTPAQVFSDNLGRPYTAGEARQIEERLRGLGYLD